MLTYLAEATLPLFVLGRYAVQRPRIGLLGLLGAIGHAYVYVYFTGSVTYSLVEHVRDWTALLARLDCADPTGPHATGDRPARLAVVSIDLDRVRRMVAREHGLAGVSVVRADGTPHSSLVNVGVLTHPGTGAEVVGYTTFGKVKLRNLRERPATSVLWRAGWQWLGLDGQCELIGPDDPADGIDAEGLRLLLRAVFTGAGGTHDDWHTYDRVLREERRAAVLITPTRLYGNS